LLAQVVFGLAWSGLFAGMEWGLTDAQITWGWPLACALALWPWARPCWPTAVVAWAFSRQAWQSRAFLPTSHHPLRPAFQPPFWASCRSCFTHWPLRW